MVWADRYELAHSDFKKIGKSIFFISYLQLFVKYALPIILDLPKSRSCRHCCLAASGDFQAKSENMNGIGIEMKLCKII